MARLIDADALMDVIREHEYRLATKQGSIDYGMFTLGIQQAVDEQPTVIENPLSGKLRGVTYKDGKIIDVHIRDTDDVVKVFVPVRHGRWIFGKDLPYSWGQIIKNKYHLYCSECLEQAFNRSEDNDPDFDADTSYCPFCGCCMDGGAD